MIKFFKCVILKQNLDNEILNISYTSFFNVNATGPHW